MISIIIQECLLLYTSHRRQATDSDNVHIRLPICSMVHGHLKGPSPYCMCVRTRMSYTMNRGQMNIWMKDKWSVFETKWLQGEGEITWQSFSDVLVMFGWCSSDVYTISCSGFIMVWKCVGQLLMTGDMLPLFVILAIMLILLIMIITKTIPKHQQTHLDKTNTRCLLQWASSSFLDICNVFADKWCCWVFDWKTVHAPKEMHIMNL